jgi:hypothetical protein
VQSFKSFYVYFGLCRFSVCTLLEFERPQVKKLFERPRRKWKDDIKMDL